MTNSNAHVPRVSIGLPVYNGEDYLREALDSLLRQTYRDFELIISDNASTDGTQAICEEYAATHARVRYFRESENRGAGWNFDRVFELARGEYFKWAAADDVCAPTFVERCVEVLDGDETIACCHSKTQKIGPDGNALPGTVDPTDGGFPSHSGNRRMDGSSPLAHRRFADVLLSSGWGVRCAGVFRSRMLRETGLMRPYFGSEKNMMAELVLRGRVHDIQETLFYQRIHDAAVSCLDSGAAQHAYYAPTEQYDRAYPRLKFLKIYLQAIRQAPVNIDDKILCLMWIVRYLFQVGKWRTIAISTWHGTGFGTVNRAALDQVGLQASSRGLSHEK